MARKATQVMIFVENGNLDTTREVARFTTYKEAEAECTRLNDEHTAAYRAAHNGTFDRTAGWYGIHAA